MLLDVVGPIKVDGKEVINNLRLNIKPQSHQLRLKMSYARDGNEDPVDLVIYQWSGIKISASSLVIDLNGEELLRKIKFQFRLSFDFFRKSWKVKGMMGSKSVNREFSSVVEVLTLMRVNVTQTKNNS